MIKIPVASSWGSAAEGGGWAPLCFQTEEGSGRGRCFQTTTTRGRSLSPRSAHPMPAGAGALEGLGQPPPTRPPPSAPRCVTMAEPLQDEERGLSSSRFLMASHYSLRPRLTPVTLSTSYGHMIPTGVKAGFGCFWISTPFCSHLNIP